MTPRSLFVLSVCVALTLQSVVGFVHVPPVAKTTTVECDLFGRNTQDEAPSSSTGRGAPKIVEISKMEEFLKFLGEDDRLCVVK